MKEKLSNLKSNIKKKAAQKIKKKKENFDLWDYIKDWVIAFAVAAVVYFIILPVFLGSSTPLVVVSSCSEKPYLNIGDIAVVQGTSIEDVKAPNLDIELYTQFQPVFEGNQVKALDFGNKTVEPSTDNDIVIYYAYPSGAQIIHRSLAKINNEYLITMGDANSIPDQYGENGICLDENTGCLSTYITDDNLVGKSVFAVPLLGHIKLFFCDIMPFCDGHANAGTNYEYKLTC